MSLTETKITSPTTLSTRQLKKIQDSKRTLPPPLNPTEKHAEEHDNADKLTRTPRVEESKINKGSSRQKKIKKSRERIRKKRRKKTRVIKPLVMSKMKDNPRKDKTKVPVIQGQTKGKAEIEIIKTKIPVIINKWTKNYHKIQENYEEEIQENWVVVVPSRWITNRTVLGRGRPPENIIRKTGR